MKKRPGTQLMTSPRSALLVAPVSAMAAAIKPVAEQLFCDWS